MKNTLIILIGVIAAVMIAGTLAVTMTTGQAFAGGAGTGGNAQNGVNGGNNAHDPCGNAGALAHIPHCQ